MIRSVLGMTVCAAFLFSTLGCGGGGTPSKPTTKDKAPEVKGLGGENSKTKPKVVTD